MMSKRLKIKLILKVQMLGSCLRSKNGKNCYHSRKFIDTISMIKSIDNIIDTRDMMVTTRKEQLSDSGEI